jgi:ferritin-like metal-binding protein YciE
METLEQLLIREIQDLYSAENQLIEALPKLVSAADAPKLKDGLANHLDQTRDHRRRLEIFAGAEGVNLIGEQCEPIRVLCEAASTGIGKMSPGPVRDAFIIACAQKCEHHEIASYGTVITWADELDMKDKLGELRDTLGEEFDADKRLSHVALKYVNERAVDATRTGGQRARLI